jgi:hypothetical protein
LPSSISAAPWFFETGRDVRNYSDAMGEEDDGRAAEELGRQPRYPARLRYRTGGFASPSFDGFALDEVELNVRIMFLQLSVQPDKSREKTASHGT